MSDKVQTAAKAGIMAPSDVLVPAGPTGQDPSTTSFFQALDIPTKINRGQVEIVSDVHLIKKGEKVGRSAAELLVKLGIKPFYYGISVNMVYDNGDVYPAVVLDLSDGDIAAAFTRATREVAALCLALNYPTAASVPHSIIDAYKNILAVGLACESYTWDNLEKVKEILKDPSSLPQPPDLQLLLRMAQRLLLLQSQRKKQRRKVLPLLEECSEQAEVMTATRILHKRVRFDSLIDYKLGEEKNLCRSTFARSA